MAAAYRLVQQLPDRRREAQPFPDGLEVAVAVQEDGPGKDHPPTASKEPPRAGGPLAAIPPEGTGSSSRTGNYRPGTAYRRRSPGRWAERVATTHPERNCPRGPARAANTRCF